MAGSVLGVDQIRAVNNAYPVLRMHIRALLSADRTGYGLMKVHFLTDNLDTTELFKIFSALTFLSSAEKRAMVRAAVYEVILDMRNEDAITAPGFAEDAGLAPVVEAAPVAGVPRLTRYTPPAFKLNVATTESVKAEVKQPEAEPAKTPTALKVVDAMRQEAKVAHDAQQAARDAAVAKLRESVAPAPVEIVHPEELAEDSEALDAEIEAAGLPADE